MKTIIRNTLLLLSLVVLPLGLTSCNSSGYSLGDASVAIATVKSLSSSDFYILLDGGQKLYPSAPIMHNYKVIDGQRILVNFTLLSGEYNEYDHLIKINSLENILTKGVDVLENEEEDDFGDDPFLISNDKYWPTGMWVSGGYLNIAFVRPFSMSEKHRISLVKNKLETSPEDEYEHLELRYNTFGDSSSRGYKALVSFNLNSLELEDKKGLMLKRINPKGEEETIELNFKKEEEEKEKAFVSETRVSTELLLDESLVD